MRSAMACAGLSAFGLVACTVEVTDRTSSPLVYNPPINEQTFRVDVDSDQRVDAVDILVPGVASGPMRASGSGAFEAALPLAPCAEIAEYSVDVTTNRGRTIRRFPEAGLFTHAITGQPASCTGFMGAVSQTFVVDREADFPDSAPGDGFCAGGTALAGGCSLRAAVMEANARRGADLIRLPPGRYTLSRDGSEGDAGVDASIRDLDITDTLTIEGTGSGTMSVVRFLVADFSNPATALQDDPESDALIAKIDGGDVDRVLHVSGAGTIARLRNLAIVNGSSDGAGGGVLNSATLVLERVALSDNAVVRPERSRIGGGAIHNDGLLVADDIVLAQNQVGGNVLNPSGGALFNEGTATIRNGLLAYNDARFGAAINNAAGAVLRLTNTTVYAHRYANSTPVSTVVNLGETTAEFVTIAGNRIGNGRMLSNAESATLRLGNSLILDNRADSGGRLCAGSITTTGGNVADADCAIASGPRGLDFFNVAVSGRGGIEDVGGFSPVYRPTIPGAGSSLFNPIDRAAALTPFPFFDQRGAPFSRRVDGDGDGSGTPDPGAYEHQG